MKLLFIYILCLLLFVNCSRDKSPIEPQDPQDTTDIQIITDWDQLDRSLIEKDPFHIDSVFVKANTIYIHVSYGGGCKEHFLEVFTATEAESALAAGIFHRREVPIEAVKQYLADRVEIRPSV